MHARRTVTASTMIAQLRLRAQGRTSQAEAIAVEISCYVTDAQHRA